MLISKVPGNHKKRRIQLMQMRPGAAFVFPSHPDYVRNDDVHHPYRQDSTMIYLSAYPEADSVLVLAQGKSYLFVRERNPHKEMWEGEHYGSDRAKSIFGVDEAFALSQLDEKLPALLVGSSELVYKMGFNREFDDRIIKVLDRHKQLAGRSGKSSLSISDPKEIVGELRVIKDAEEIQLMRDVCKFTALGHKSLMQTVKPGMNEWEVEAEIDYSFRKLGCERLGYGSIVAGGKNAACLHYRFNNDPLKDGELLLVDAGGEYRYYGGDITRTFPIGKKFNDWQAKAYDLVLKANLEGIKMAKPGSNQIDIHNRCTEVLVEGFLSLGLLKGNAQDLIAKNEQMRFYPHRTGHFLGMDVHDAGLYFKNGQPTKLEPGMTFTIEPGFYIQPDDAGLLAGELPHGFQSFGIRIEDDILITDSGCEVMTRDVPKERGEIEELRAKAF